MFDIAIVGAGPAGSAAAIFAALNGLKVVLIEREGRARVRPGETLPPGAQVIFTQLGVWESVSQTVSIRHPGHYTCDKLKQTIFHPYGEDKNGKWCGIQILRHHLDTILQTRVQKLGVCLVRDAIKHVVIENNKLHLVAEHQTIHAKYYLDAAGARHLFARKLNIPIVNYSPEMIARFGYLKENCPYVDLPIFIQAEKGWQWYAKVAHQLYAWVSVQEKGVSMPYKASGGADVTWRLVKDLAGLPFFLVGDAAGVLDPSAGHGVLRALMSGMMAVHTILQMQRGQLSPKVAYQAYHTWLTDWFQSDMDELKKRK